MDRYDPRDVRDRTNTWDRESGSRGGTSERDRGEEGDPRDVFTKDLDLPRGRERRSVRERDRVYEINGPESRMLATVGAFRVVSERDLHDGRDDTRSAQGGRVERVVSDYELNRKRKSRCLPGGSRRM
jgi:hypothetical protein